MSQRDLTRIAVLSDVLAGQRTVVAAAYVLDISVRQTFRLLARYQELGGSGLAHKARGREVARVGPPPAVRHRIDAVIESAASKCLTL
jgi:hypothetical protein